MAGGIEKLTALKVARLSKPGRHGDGKGLCLQITKQGAKSWIFRFERDGKERFMGLGPLHTVSLSEAREKARLARKCLVEGIDPLAKRDGEIAARKTEEVRNLDFDACTAQYIESRGAEWKNAKHRQQWERSLQTYVSPHFGCMHVRRIDTPLVLKALGPIWRTKTETASRIRERIERVCTDRSPVAGAEPACDKREAAAS